MLLALVATFAVGPAGAGAAEVTVVSSTSPADGATNVPVNANLTVTFNQAVTVDSSWAQMFCTKSGTHALVVSGGPQVWQLAPQGDRATNESCGVTIDASKVEGMLLNYTFTFVTSSELPANTAPRADAGGPYAVDEGGSVLVTATATDDEGDPLTYAWDLDGNGTFETSGAAVTFSAVALDGPSVRTITVRVSDGELSDTADATVTVANVAPTATLSAPGTVAVGSPFGLGLTAPADPSTADTTAGFLYAFDCGGGYGAFGSNSTASCTASEAGSVGVGAKIEDKDGGVTEYRATVDVVVTYDGLCALAWAYSSKPQIAAELCNKLQNAAAAPEATARAGLLDAFRNQVKAQTGKAFTAAEAASLDALAASLEA